MSIVYLTDSISRVRMENFFNTNMSKQNIVENSSWIGGEYYIQTSLYNTLKKLNNAIIIDIDKDFDSTLLDNSILIISPGWSDIPEAFKKYKQKLYTYHYFKGSSIDFDKRIINPFIYTKKNLTIPIVPIILPEYSKSSINFNNFNISGLLVGKCISHVISKKKRR